MFDIRGALSSLNRRVAAEALTPWIVEKPEKRGYRWRIFRSGALHVLDWGKGPRFDFGGVLQRPGSALPRLRIPTDADAASIDAALATIEAARRQAERVYARAWARGRQPTVDEIRNYSAGIEEGLGG